MICALDTKPTPVSEEHLTVFHLLAHLVAFEMEAEERRLEQESKLAAAQEAAKVRDQFIAILGHDLRNPLNAIAVASAVLQQDTKLSLENQTLARVIAKSGKRMSRLVEDTLDLTRGQVGNGIPISPSPNKLNDVCLQVMSELRVAHANREIIFESHGEGDGYFDENRAAQVISNLLSNAIHHGAPDQPVRLILRNEDGHIYVDVHNCGEPIPADKHDSLFDPFKRGTLSQEEAMSSQGLGLGLYIAREIMNAHNGDIRLTSDENGTTFSTRWPRQTTE